MEFRILGPLEVRADDGASLVPPRRKQRVLLGLLLLHAGQPLQVERIADELWGERPPSSAMANLQSYISGLRRMLGHDRISTHRGRYTLQVGGGELDARVFVDLLGQGQTALRSGDHSAARHALARGLALWRGRPLEDLPELHGPETTRLEDLKLAAVEDAVESQLGLGRHLEAAVDLRELVQRHPLRERLWGQYMLALYRSGRQAEALERYREVSALLGAELGIDPGPELRRLHQAILAHDPGLDPPRAPAATASTGNSATGSPAAPPTVPPPTAHPPAAAEGPGHAGPAAPDGPGEVPTDGHTPAAAPAGDPDPDILAGSRPQLPVPAQLPLDIADFTGREEQVARLTRAVRRRDDPDRPQTVVVSAVAGMGGVGKTALVIHVAHRLVDAFPDGQLYADLHGQGDAPSDPGEILGRFLRALGVSGSAVPDSLEERAALYRSRLAGRRVLVVLDNASAERQVRPLLPGAPECAVLVTSRNQLTGLEGAALLDLDVFEPSQAVELLTRIVGAERVAAEPLAAAEIAELCGCVPLAVRIAGARLAGKRQWSLAHLAAMLRDERRRLDELAAGDLGVRASFSLSYRRLSEPARRTFRLLGLLEAPDFASWVVAALLDVPLAEAEAHVDTLVDARFLTIVGVDATGRLRYRMHDLIRLYAWELTQADDDPAERAAATERALGAWLWLAERAAEYVPGPCYAVMHGDAPRYPLPTSVATEMLHDPMRWMDAERAALVAAARQACALRLDELAWDLAGCLEKYCDVRGLYDEWQHTHEQAIRLCREVGNRRGEAVLLRGLLEVTTWTSPRQSSGAAMVTLHDRGQQLLEIFSEVGERRGMADALISCAWGLVAQGDREEALLFAERALHLAEGADYLGGQARAHHIMAIALADSDPHQSIAYLREALKFGELLGNRRFQATALQFLGAVYFSAGYVDTAHDYLSRSLTMAHALQDRYLEAFSLLYLARVFAERGDQRAMPTAEAVLALSREGNFGHHLADALALLGELHLAEGDTAAAVARLEESVDVWRSRGWLIFLARTLRSLGEAHVAAGDPHRAHRAWQEAHELFTRLGDTAAADEVTELLEAHSLFKGPLRLPTL
ncbi:AfsR/SARP family transcriptional regulator [Allostreptomyces psammosilenae]|uniref:DNA-binding SARP family transcriptional activator n=1 Tax=Allostreptomyces psammosilenae TaxID=1892865 RepID=A0A852ZYQ9_9ACTN|nr:BTAD domain-containing putative transcriptional regulator [Allostreptomyces psammosilenae]NYI03228.1 DNA-binding SARP family transcriptional activator [Allostreptomyces psammosilenae]